MRSSPEELLQVVQRMEGNARRGKLRVFLGMCPGVGKTYAMLRAAREQLNRGRKVLAGVVETHSRKETEELLQGIPLCLKKEVEHKGHKLAEMDLDELLRLKPDCVLVDELAHTNVDGSRHQKRYQDVEELLAAGIDVFTTLNIQHVESRNDQVAQITKVIVRETVPDSVLEKADQIELIDISPDELLRRLREGKVYLGDRAAEAARNFFKEEHLLALRELALRFTAEKVDQDLQDQMTVKGIAGPWNTNERLLVAISHSPYSARLIRATRRMAYTLEAPWVALYVNTGALLSQDDQTLLQKNLNLARELGAEVITMADLSIVDAIQKVSAEKNVTQIVMGRPDRRFFRDLFTRGTLLDQLVRSTSMVDVHVIRAERKPRYQGFHLKLPELQSGISAYLNTFWFLLACSTMAWELLPYLGYRALGSIFLLAILIVSLLASRGPILFAALFSSLVWNYFFIPPTFTFVVSSREDLMMLVSFFVAALVSAFLTTKVRKQDKILQSREILMRSLYQLSRGLAESQDKAAIIKALSKAIRDQLGGEAIALLCNDSGILEHERRFAARPISEKDFAVASWVFDHGKTAGWSTQTLSAAPCICFPMKGNTKAMGVLVYYPDKKNKQLGLEEENFLETAISQAASAAERLNLRKLAENTRVLEASERLHQTLLNSVSHELRTPITALIGGATALRDPAVMADKNHWIALSDELVHSARRLNHVVENLLDASRLERGTLQLKREWFVVEELLQNIRSLMKEELGNRDLIILGELDSLLEADFKLLEHALLNIIQNAIRYSPAGSPINISVKNEQTFLRIEVSDSGIGIPSGEEQKIFEKFYRIPGTSAGGLGLGLSLVKSIVELHDGDIIASNREDGPGALFIIRLPIREVPKKLQEMIR